ncbi:MAG: chaperone CsaA [Flavobacteriales bacterium]|jgi:tRNA-binding protein|nr:chaperone CsaA [Flavobacteriales bacterium]
MENATFEDFQKIDLRVGTIINAEPFPEARKPAYKLTIDFGALGTKQSSAQITKRYKTEELIGRQIVAVFNFSPKKVAGFKSEVLVLGATPEADDVVLLSPENELPNGSVVS